MKPFRIRRKAARLRREQDRLFWRDYKQMTGQDTYAAFAVKTKRAK